MQTYLKTRPAWIQLLLFLGMAFGLFIILLFFGASILTKMTGISLLDIQDVSRWDPNNPQMIFFLRGMMLLQFLGLFLIPPLLFSYFSDPVPSHYLGIKKPHQNIYWILAVSIMMVSIPAVEYLGFLNQKISLGGAAQSWIKNKEQDATKQIQFMLHQHQPVQLILNLVFISLFAGIGEELFFRGVLQRILIKAFKSPWAGIILTAILFSAFHLQFFGFLPRLLLGIILGAIYWFSGSLLTAILAHFFYDAFIIILLYLYPEMIKNADQPMIQSQRLPIIAFVSAGLSLVLLWVMKRKSRTSYKEIYKNDGPQEEHFTF